MAILAPWNYPTLGLWLIGIGITTYGLTAKNKQDSGILMHETIMRFTTMKKPIAIAILFAGTILSSGGIYWVSINLTETDEVIPLELQDNDGDGIVNEFDNCPDLFDLDQSDIDEDGMGNPCDLDDDGDGVNDYDDFIPDFDAVLYANFKIIELNSDDEYDTDGSGPDLYWIISTQRNCIADSWNEYRMGSNKVVDVEQKWYNSGYSYPTDYNVKLDFYDRASTLCLSISVVDVDNSSDDDNSGCNYCSEPLIINPNGSTVYQFEFEKNIYQRVQQDTIEIDGLLFDKGINIRVRFTIAPEPFEEHIYDYHVGVEDWMWENY